MILSLIPLIPALALAWLFFPVVLDDPFITFRYAYNIVHHGALSWNPNEQPVEGFTEPLMLIVASLAIMNGYDPLITTKLIGLISLLLLILGCTHVLSKELGSPSVASYAAATLFALPLLPFYAVTGMGHLTWTLFLLAAIWSSIQSTDAAQNYSFSLLSGFFWSAALFTRPETVAFFGATMVVSAIRARRRSSVAITVGIFMIALISIHMFRYWYFGALLPNTFYAKHHGLRWDDYLLGILYLSNFMQRFGLGYGVALMIGLGVSQSRFIEMNTFQLTGLANLTVAVIYPVALGGDDISAFPTSRLFIPALVLLGVCAWVAVQKKEEFGRRETTKIVSYCAALGTGMFPVIASAGTVFELTKIARPDLSWRTRDLGWLSPGTTLKKPERHPLSEWLKKHEGPSCIVAITFAGRVPFETPGCYFLDVLGLNDKHIAAQSKVQRGVDVKGDPLYILARNPRFIILSVDRRVWSEVSFAEGGVWRQKDAELIEKAKASGLWKRAEDAPGPWLVLERIVAQNE